MQTIAHYRITAKLGAGAMGDVYRAHDTKLGRDVALKILPSVFTDDPERLARFKREARVLASLNHPHIAAIYGIEDDGGIRALVLELVEGETLASRLRRGPVPIPEALAMAVQIVDALNAAHRKGIVHRDLKPANIQITPDGMLKVLDFGLAKVATAELTQSPTVTIDDTREGVILGTAAYMSPEQARGKPIDKSTDIWAFGCVLYELLTGRRAFRGETLPDIIAAVLEREPDWKALPGTTPEKIRHLLQRALQKDAHNRLRDLGDARVGLEQAIAAPAKGAESDRVPVRRPRRAARKRIRSLAVLPLINLSGDPEHEFFADGMTDALITTLAQIGALRIISRTSVMRYKGAGKPLPDIARELNVEVVLEGTVLRSGDRVRIAVQLIDALSDTHLWAKNYESDLRDILTVQSEVAQAVAQEIKIKLTPQEQAHFSAARPVDPEAYEAFLKGRYYWYRRSPDALNKSLEYLERAVAKDPTYALAHAGLADTWVSLGWDLFAGCAPSEGFPKAKLSVRKALDLDPNCAEALAAYGWTAGAYDWDWIAAERSLRRAVELKPQYGPAHIWYSHFLHGVGRIQESFEESQRAIQCDPLGIILNVHLGWHYVYDREYDRAVEQLNKTLELDPDFILARMFLGEAHEQMGRLEEALAEFEKAANLSRRRPVYLAGLGHAYAVSGQKQRAAKIIEELHQRSSETYVAPRGIAEIYIGLGEKDHAFVWLDKAVEQRNGWLIHVRTNPRYDGLRSDSRFADLVRRIGLP